MQTGTRIEVDDETPFAESYERLLPQLQALASEELMRINLDIPSAVVTALGALPRIRALRPRIADELPRFDLERFDQLEDCALGLSHAHTRYLTATRPPDGMGPLLEEALGLRETLLGDAMALGRRHHIDPNRLKQLKGTNGHKNVATDLQILGTVLGERWAEIENRCGIEEAELLRAAKLAAAILRLVGLRGQAATTVPAAAEMRVRAFTLFWRAYEQARRAAIYLTWGEADADRIAPSLYAGRSNGRGREKEEGERENDGATPTPTEDVAGGEADKEG
jgi:hypothetical protein